MQERLEAHLAANPSPRHASAAGVDCRIAELWCWEPVWDIWCEHRLERVTRVQIRDLRRNMSLYSTETLVDVDSAAPVLKRV
jgi:hypothetical protein